MKIKVRYILGIATLAIMLLPAFASAEKLTDKTNDVWHVTWDTVKKKYTWEKSVENKPNIDITEISYEIDGNTLTLTLTVVGEIEDSENVGYWAYYNTTDATYYFAYTNGVGYCMGMSSNSFVQGEVTKSGNKITATVELIGSKEKVEAWGWAAQYTNMGDTKNEWWGDWVPQETPPGYEPTEENGEDTKDNQTEGGGKDTPGFELIAFSAAIAVAFALRKRH